MKRLIFLLIVVGGAVGAYYAMRQPLGPLVLTGIVTTEDVIISPQVGGQIGQLMVREGDQVDERWYDRIVDFEIGPLIREYYFDDADKAEELIAALRR